MNEAVVEILESFLGDHRKHNSTKSQIAFDCPACAEDKGLGQGDGKGNLEVNYEKGVFKCWACADINNMSGRIPFLIKRYGEPRHLREFKIFAPELIDYTNKEVVDVKVMTELPKEFISFTEGSKYDMDYTKAMRYLQKRRVTSEIIKKHNIGYIKEGQYANRVIIPSNGGDNTVNYFIARAYGYNKLKYMNPDIEKQSIIFNQELINWDATVYLVEGAFDHIVVPNSIPLLGKYMYDILFDLLLEKVMGYVVIVLDGDAIKDAEKLYKQLNTSRLRGKIRIVILPEELDLSLINEKYGMVGVYTYLQTAHKIPEHIL